MHRRSGIRVLALTRYSRAGASSRVRFYQYLTPLAREGIELEIHPLFEDYYVRALYERRDRIGATLGSFARRVHDLLGGNCYDAVWIEKELLPWVPAFFELMLLPRKVRIILDYDDAVFHRYDLHESAIVRSALGQKLDRLMARADLVLAGNDYLAERAQNAGAKRVAIVPTVVDLDRYQPTAPDAAGMVTVGWIGSPSTARYLDQVKPLVDELVATGKARAVAIGARPDQVEGSSFQAVKWTEDSEVEQLARCDIGIMPLDDTPWERGKCGYKLIQYMALALPVVASPVGVNVSLVADGNGFLARNAQEWTTALLSLVTDARLRRTLGASGRAKVAREYCLQVWAAPLAALLRGA